MYNLLLVDDEPIIVDSYFEYLSDEFGDILNIQKAYSPTEALQKAHNRVDILITDITMPRINGYELQKQITKVWPRCRVIFLTGHDSVNYAQTAIRSSSFIDYVLKSEHYDVLIKAVNKAIYSTKNIIKSDEVLENTQKNIRLAMPLLRKELVMDIINGKITDMKDIHIRLNQYDIELSVEEPVVLLCAAIDENMGSKHDIYTNAHSLTLAIDSILSEHLKHTHNLYGIYLEDNLFLWFIQLKQLHTSIVEPNRRHEYIYSYLDIIQESCKKILHISVSFILSDSECQWSGLHQNFQQLIKAERRNRNLSESILLVEETSTDSTGMVHDNRLDQLLSTLTKALKTGDHSAFNSNLKVLANEFPSADWIEIHYKLCLLFIKCLENNFIPYHKYKAICIELFNINVTTASIESIISAYIRISQSIFIEFVEYNNKVLDVINLVEKYISKNLSGDLSLTTIASMVHHSPTYFSKLFKKSTGHNYSMYVILRRLDKAQDLLTKTNEKIGDIAAYVGYDSVPYFIKSFKKVYNKTPLEYRHGQQQSD